MLTALTVFVPAVLFAGEEGIPSPVPPGLEPVALPGLLAEAEENNPDILAAKARWMASKKMIAASWALPDPVAGFDLMGEDTQTRTGPQEQRFVLSQKIPNPLTLWQRRKIALQHAEELKQDYLTVRRHVLSEVRRNFYALYGVDAAYDVIREVQSLLEKMEDAAQSRYANRGGGQRDVAKAQAEVSMTLEQIYLMVQERQIVTARLNLLLNRSPFDEFGRALRPELPEVEPTVKELIHESLKNREERRAREARLERARAERTLAALQNLPDLEAGFTYTRVGGGTSLSPQDGEDTWMIPLRFRIPLWQNRVIPEIQAARQRVKEAEAGLEGEESRIFYEVKDAYIRYETGSRIARLYETAVIPQAEIALGSDQAGYESGSVDILNLLDSERMYLNARLTHLRVTTEALKSLVDLERAVGKNLSGGA